MTEQEIKLAKELALYMVRHGITDTEKGMTAWIDSNKKMVEAYKADKSAFVSEIYNIVIEGN
jgi:hypothetical protein